MQIVGSLMCSVFTMKYPTPIIQKQVSLTYFINVKKKKKVFLGTCGLYLTVSRQEGGAERGGEHMQQRAQGQHLNPGQLASKNYSLCP